MRCCSFPFLLMIFLNELHLVFQGLMDVFSCYSVAFSSVLPCFTCIWVVAFVVHCCVMKVLATPHLYFYKHLNLGERFFIFISLDQNIAKNQWKIKDISGIGRPRYNMEISLIQWRAWQLILGLQRGMKGS